MSVAAHRPVAARVGEQARQLRRTMPDAERRLWAHLRGHRFDGLGFRRQSPIGHYIADFVCHEARLILEVDGGQHGSGEQQRRDQVRDRWFAEQGYRTLRVWNNDVLQNLEGVLEVILLACRDQSPPSQPSPARGEGSGRVFPKGEPKHQARMGRKPGNGA